MKKFFVVLFGVFVLFGCDLQPKIVSIPDSVGEFITERYPTLLAEPDSEIYKTAVADYGVYASPTVYGSGDISDADYVLYSPADDYMMPAQDTHVDDADSGMPDDEVDADEYGFAPDENVDDLKIPDYVTEKKTEVVIADKRAQKTESVEPKSESKSEPESKDFVRAPLREITIEKGDTLYSLSRKYAVPVNDLVVMNKISAPFTLSVGQKIKVPDILSVPKYNAPERAADTKKSVAKTDKKPTELAKKQDAKKSESKTDTKNESAVVKSAAGVAKAGTAAVATTVTANKATKPVVKPDTKSVAKKSDVKKSSDKQKKADNKKSDVKKTDKKSDKKSETKKKADVKKSESKRTASQMVARSSSKFSWPVRGKILSGYGSKSNGLFNDGINIQASRGAAVLAAENGLVAYAGNEVKGMGNLVIIQHADGWMTVYAHMNSFVVRRGHSVSVGQKIGTVGTSGKVDQPQLHFEIRKGTRAYNPVNYLKK